MKSKVLFWPMLAIAATLSAQTQKVAVINVQGAIVSTKDGQKASAELETKAAPKRKDLEIKQNEINTLKDQLNKGQNTLSEATKAELYKNIEIKTKSLQRDYEDANAEFDQETQKILQQLGQKILAVIERYARDNSYTLVLDVSSQQSPIMYASPTIDITKDIIDLYDKNSGAMSNPAPANKPPATAPIRPTTPATKPPTPGKP